MEEPHTNISAFVHNENNHWLLSIKIIAYDTTFVPFKSAGMVYILKYHV